MGHFLYMWCLCLNCLVTRVPAAMLSPSAASCVPGPSRSIYHRGVYLIYGYETNTRYVGCLPSMYLARSDDCPRARLGMSHSWDESP